jgi:glycyl-tRNA synthetase beta chain
MADFLLELFSEEIPARMQEAAAQQLERVFSEAIKEAGLTTKAIKTYVTPRRVALTAEQIPGMQSDVTTEKKGPKTSAPQAAIDGFLKSSGLCLEQLEKRMVGKDETYFAVIHQKGQPTALLLKPMIEKILAGFAWPKSMRWGSGETRWVRPLHSILCIFDSKVVPVEFAGITAGNITYGHRFLAPDAIAINNPAEYAPALKKAFVIADAGERKAEIVKQAEALAGKHDLRVKRDDGLLNEVTGLVEWPTALMGKIDDSFMDLPPEVLISEMRAHQKYFALQDASGTFSSSFLIISNMVAGDGGKAIVSGNERVLRARLSDGRFFWDQDRKKPLSNWAEGLKGVTFHAKIGTVAEKVTRIKALASELAHFVPGADKALVERAAELCKADLVTGMVGEFPELQGVMGRYYALQQKEDPQVADAIRDHYLPLGPDSPVPTKPISICIALADKLDTLISMFAAGEKPTGSKDPFALRRAALGVIRIILEYRVRLNLRVLLLQPLLFSLVHVNVAEQKRIKGNSEFDVYDQPYKASAALMSLAQDAILLGKMIRRHQLPDKRVLLFIDDLLSFFSDRLKVQLKDQGIRHDLINAVMANGDDDLVRVVSRAKALQEFLATDDGANLLAAYKRASNIVGIEEKKDKLSYTDKIEDSVLTAPEEKQLFDMLIKTRLHITTALEQEKFTEAMKALSALRGPVDAFFDKVLVNAPDAALRANRLRLLAYIRFTLDQIADFSLIEG